MSITGIYTVKTMMPRRIPDYPDAYAGWNLVSSFGSLISVGATAVFLYTIYDMLTNQPATEDNAWGTPIFFTDTQSFNENTPHSNTLDWVVPSPTPMHAFAMLPVQS